MKTLTMWLSRRQNSSIPFFQGMVSPLSLLITAFVGLAPATTKAQGTKAQNSIVDAKLGRQIDQFMGQKVDGGSLAGAAVAVVHKGKVAFIRGYGSANIPEKRPVTINTSFQIASISKPFAAVSVALLMRDGKIKLEDHISTFVKDLPVAWRKITVRQLLNHTSGIKDYAKFQNMRKLYKQDFSRREMLAHLYGHALEFEPGADHAYSNSGYTMIGLVVESAAGMPYEKFLRTRIFELLEMNNSRLEPPRNQDPARAIGYDVSAALTKPASYNSPTWSFAAGGIVSSIADLAKFDAAIDGAKILSAVELEQLWSPQKVDGKPTGFGLGWQLRPAPGGKQFVYHLGGKPGFDCAMARLVEDRITIIVLTNTTGGGAGKILDTIGKQILANR